MWEALVLSPSGRPLMMPQEVEILVQGQVSVYDNQHKILTEALGILTTHRICAITPNRAIALQIHTCRDVEKTAKVIGFSSPKIVIRIKDSEQVAKLSFQQGGRDAFFDALVHAIHIKSWITSNVGLLI